MIWTLVELTVSGDGSVSVERLLEWGLIKDD